MIEKEVGSYGGQSSWHRLIKEAYKRELIAYITALDTWTMRETDDPFICCPIIGNYLEEFQAFAEGQTYQPGGLINTELLLLYSLIRHAKPDVFIESGTKNAYSSLFIAQALRQNDSGSKLYCLSIFSGDEYRIAKKRLQPYEFVTIKEGYSEDLIDEVSKECRDRNVAMLIDGPKARSKSWDTLTDKVSRYFPGLMFLCFDATQEHIPFWTPSGTQYDPKRSINIERIKTIHLFQKDFQDKGYKLTIQSNQFCRKYYYLNEMIYKYRNERWGRVFPWGPYRVDRIENHIAHSYKMGVIYQESILQ